MPAGTFTEAGVSGILGLDPEDTATYSVSSVSGTISIALEDSRYPIEKWKVVEEDTSAFSGTVTNSTKFRRYYRLRASAVASGATASYSLVQDSTSSSGGTTPQIWVNDYGSGFDGSADDTQAWIDAITAAQNIHALVNVPTIHFQGVSSFDPMGIYSGNAWTNLNVYIDGQIQLLDTWHLGSQTNIVGTGGKDSGGWVQGLRCSILQLVDNTVPVLHLGEFGSTSITLTNVKAKHNVTNTSPCIWLDRCTDVQFYGVEAGAGTGSSAPAILVNNQLWAWFEFCRFSSSATGGASMHFDTLDALGGHRNGIIRVRDTNIGGQGILLTASGQTGDVAGNWVFDNMTYENCQSSFFTLNLQTAGDYLTRFQLKECNLADPKTLPLHLIDCVQGHIKNLRLQNCGTAHGDDDNSLLNVASPDQLPDIMIIDGEVATADFVFSGAMTGVNELSVEGPGGFSFNHALPKIALTSSDSDLGVTPSESDWSHSGALNVTTGIEAPDGSLEAVELENTSGGELGTTYVDNSSPGLEIDDFVIAGGWARGQIADQSPTGFDGPFKLSTTLSSDTIYLSPGEISSGTDEAVYTARSIDRNSQFGWHPYIGIWSVQSPDSEPLSARITMSTTVKNNFTVRVWQPFLHRVRGVTWLEAKQIGARLLDVKPRNWFSQVDTVGNVGAGEDDLHSITLRAYLLNQDGGGIRILASGISANNANAKTVILYFGSTALYTASLTVSQVNDWRFEAEVVRTAASAQRISVKFDQSGTTEQHIVDYITATEDDTAAIVVKCTGEATADDDIQQTIMTISRLQ